MQEVVANLKSHDTLLLDLLGESILRDIDGFMAVIRLNLLNNQTGRLSGDAYRYNYKYAATVFDAFTQFKFSYDKKLISIWHNPTLLLVRIIKEDMYKSRFRNNFPSVKASTL
jgi:hypothetical protein